MLDFAQLYMPKPATCRELKLFMDFLGICLLLSNAPSIPQTHEIAVIASVSIVVQNIEQRILNIALHG